MRDLFIIIYYFLFFAIPLFALGFFGVSLYRYLYAKKANRKNPDTFSAEEIKNRKLLLVVSSVIVGVLVAIVIGIVILLCMAIAYM